MLVDLQVFWAPSLLSSAFRLIHSVAAAATFVSGEPIAANLEPKRCPDQPNEPPLQTFRSPSSRLRPTTIPNVKESPNRQGGRRDVLTVTMANHRLQSSSPFMIITNHRSLLPDSATATTPSGLRADPRTGAR
ncbi:hypothetical protein Droror1_Dr00007895 [Drosera rotundifolia]